MHARHKITQKSNLLHSTPVTLKRYSTYKKRRADLESTAFSEIAKDVHKTVVYRDGELSSHDNFHTKLELINS